MMLHKKVFTSILILIFLGICLPGILLADSRSMPNPAMLYANWLGYAAQIVTKADGSQYGIVTLPDKTICDVWDFYKGKAGQAFSYCASKGFETSTEQRTIGTYTTECAICQSSEGGADIPMIELMQQNKESILDLLMPIREPALPNDTAQGEATVPTTEGMNTKKELPSQFDWRNVEGHTYIGPIRDQGSCGSCYAFAATAAAEGTYNFATDKKDAECLDFSESFIAWCLGRLPAYDSHFFGCQGADYDYQELLALTQEGIILESAFPYIETDPGTCTHMNDPATRFKSWGRIQSNDVAAIKTALQNYGVLDAAVMVDNNFEGYSDGVYTDTATDCPEGENTATNHAISLVGWGNDSTAGDYWVLRNSWGESWGENGYMRIAVTSSRVGCAAAYLEFKSPVPHVPFNLLLN